MYGATEADRTVTVCESSNSLDVRKRQQAMATDLAPLAGTVGGGFFIGLYQYQKRPSCHHKVYYFLIV